MSAGHFPALPSDSNRMNSHVFWLKEGISKRFACPVSYLFVIEMNSSFTRLENLKPNLSMHIAI